MGDTMDAVLRHLATGLDDIMALEDPGDCEFLVDQAVGNVLVATGEGRGGAEAFWAGVRRAAGWQAKKLRRAVARAERETEKAAKAEARAAARAARPARTPKVKEEVSALVAEAPLPPPPAVEPVLVEIRGIPIRDVRGMADPDAPPAAKKSLREMSSEERAAFYSARNRKAAATRKAARA